MSVSSDGTLTRKSKRANVFVLTCSSCLPNFIFLHQTTKFFINFMNFLTFLGGAVEPFGPAHLRNQWNMLNGQKTDFSAKFHEFWSMLKSSKSCKRGLNSNNSFNYNRSSHHFSARALIRNQGHWEKVLNKWAASINNHEARWLVSTWSPVWSASSHHPGAAEETSQQGAEHGAMTRWHHSTTVMCALVFLQQLKFVIYCFAK